MQRRVFGVHVEASAHALFTHPYGHAVCVSLKTHCELMQVPFACGVTKVFALLHRAPGGVTQPVVQLIGAPPPIEPPAPPVDPPPEPPEPPDPPVEPPADPPAEPPPALPAVPPAVEPPVLPPPVPGSPPELLPGVQVPTMQLKLKGQLTHERPPRPHATVSTPATHLPWESQQPEQFDELHAIWLGGVPLQDSASANAITAIKGRIERRM